jgi:hypothetical protein
MQQLLPKIPEYLETLDHHYFKTISPRSLKIGMVTYIHDT